MSCGGRVYKGDSVTISVPFDVSGYTDLTISYSTTGDSKIVKGEDEVTIEDGFISYTFSGDELDILPDGVIYYTINYEVDGTDYVDSTNTPLYLATPAGYSGKTAEEIYQDGFDAGLDACSGGTPCNLEEGSVTVTGRIGTYYPTSGYDGFGSVVVDASEYGEQMAAAGYEAGLEACSGDTPCDCTSAITEAYQDGYDSGRNSITLQNSKSISLYSGFTGSMTFQPDAGYDGMRHVSVIDDGYGQKKYDSGYTHGVEVERSYIGSISITQNGWYRKALGGYNVIYVNVPTTGGGECNLTEGYLELHGGDNGTWELAPSSANDGFSTVVIRDIDYGEHILQRGEEIGFDLGYAAGLEACESGDCSELITEAYESGITEGIGTGYNQGENSIIQSFLSENDTNYIIAYYYSDDYQYCAITGVYMSHSGQSTSDWEYGYCGFSAMSVNGGAWEPVTLVRYLRAGWTQIRFATSPSGATSVPQAAFCMQATSAKTSYNLDALKAVSIPKGITLMRNNHAFYMNPSIRVLSSNLRYVDGDALERTDNLNVVISHYKGDSRITMSTGAGSANGVLFYPSGYENTIPNLGNISAWTHIGLF